MTKPIRYKNGKRGSKELLDLLVGEMTLVDGEVRFMGMTADNLRAIAKELDKRNSRFNRRSKVFAKRAYARQLEQNARASIITEKEGQEDGDTRV